LIAFDLPTAQTWARALSNAVSDPNASRHAKSAPRTTSGLSDLDSMNHFFDPAETLDIVAIRRKITGWKYWSERCWKQMVDEHNLPQPEVVADERSSLPQEDGRRKIPDDVYFAILLRRSQRKSTSRASPIPRPSSGRSSDSSVRRASSNSTATSLSRTSSTTEQDKSSTESGPTDTSKNGFYKPLSSRAPSFAGYLHRKWDRAIGIVDDDRGFPINRFDEARRSTDFADWKDLDNL
jgi:hypothetical protein